MKIIQKMGRGEIVEKKSRFIGEIYPVKTEEEAKEILSQVKKKYYDAKHHCYALRFQDSERCSDDGEPHGTAGRPILEVLQHQEITGVLAVVTRYFGGTLLGTGGLVRAYTKAVKEGLAAAEVVEMHRGHQGTLTISYSLLTVMEQKFKDLGILQYEVEYGEQVRISCIIRAEQKERFEQMITETTDGTVVPDLSEETWVAVKIGGESHA